MDSHDFGAGSSYRDKGKGKAGKRSSSVTRQSGKRSHGAAEKVRVLLSPEVKDSMVTPTFSSVTSVFGE